MRNYSSKIYTEQINSDGINRWISSIFFHRASKLLFSLSPLNGDCLSFCLSFCLSVCLPACLSVCLGRGVSIDKSLNCVLMRNYSSKIYTEQINSLGMNRWISSIFFHRASKLLFSLSPLNGDCLSVCLSFCLSVCLSACLPACLCLSVRPSVCPSACLSLSNITHESIFMKLSGHVGNATRSNPEHFVVFTFNNLNTVFRENNW